MNLYAFCCCCVLLGKSLDKCMELREMKKLGIVGKQKKKKKRKIKGHHHHHGDGGGQPAKKENVFDFLNQKLGGKKSKHTIKFSDEK